MKALILPVPRTGLEPVQVSLSVFETDASTIPPSGHLSCKKPLQS